MKPSANPSATTSRNSTTNVCGVGLRRDVGHGIGRFDGDHAGAIGHARRDLLEHRHVGTVAAGNERRDDRQPHRGAQHEQLSCFGNALLGLVRLSEHLPHLALFFERERIVHLLQDDQRVLSNRAHRAVEQPVTGPHDIGLVVSAQQNADVARLALDAFLSASLPRFRARRDRPAGRRRSSVPSPVPPRRSRLTNGSRRPSGL